MFCYYFVTQNTSNKIITKISKILSRKKKKDGKHINLSSIFFSMFLYLLDISLYFLSYALFSDTETSENISQQFVGGYLSGDKTQIIQRLTNIHHQ